MSSFRLSTFFHQTVFEGGGSGAQQTPLGQFPLRVFALNCPTLPACVTSPGAGHPGSCHPLRSWAWSGGDWTCRWPWDQDRRGLGGCSGAGGGGCGSRGGGLDGLRVWDQGSCRLLWANPARHVEAVTNI